MWTKSDNRAAPELGGGDRRRGLLSGLGADSRAALVVAARMAGFNPGAPLFPEGCGADAPYVIREGIFHALKPDLSKEPRLVRILSPGDGVDAVIELAGKRRPVTVRSVGEGAAASFRGAEVNRLVGVLSGLSSIFGPIDAEELTTREAEGELVAPALR